MPKVKCPNCRKESEYEGNNFRPFCSERCKLLDFGAWADGEYALPAETSSLNEDEINEIDQAIPQEGS